ncbi:ZIP family metal transporter [Pseudorhizobium endolithicum]|uniref:ZIP family metal transporter n=1 Tax=Pseudorhizobium endolithicum TaxID=1191678 RepID=UPI0011582265|nr:ZIP family metal transporter [Pseudorhizobium endolithicum]
MQGSFLSVFAIALVAGLASPAGGALAIWLRPSTLLLSVSVGLAAGVLIGTFAFEMMPKALEVSSLPVASFGFALGFALIYGLDFYVNRGMMAGPEAQQRESVEQALKRKRPRSSNAAVLAGGTSSEELVEGVAIGVGAAADPSVALIVGLAICVDNISEAMSIGQLMLSEGKEGVRRRILGWTSLIGASLFISAMVGWFLLRGLPEAVQGFLFALGAGGMFYLTVTDVIPEAEARQFQQSSAIATGIGFLLVMVLSELT